MAARRLEAFQRALADAGQRRAAAVMGVCNVTPDSFSDGGRHATVEAAQARVDELLEEGAAVIDVGGESTRPGARPVPAEEQLARVLPVVTYAASRGAVVSIDTASPTVAAACLDAGACAVNDVSRLRDDGLAKVVAANGAALVLMHARGTQEEMRGFSQHPDDAYGDVVDDVLREWNEAASRAVACGVPREALVMDPGLGFMKNARHSLELLRRTGELVARAGAPVAVGASRKSFLATVDKTSPPGARLGASVAAALHASAAGAAIVRVHDVRATRQALDLAAALKGPPAASNGSKSPAGREP